jgi:hypothetical protein
VVSEHYSALRSKPKENTPLADNTSELQGYHTDSDALDNIMEKLYLVIEDQVLQTFLPTLLGREIASLLHVFPMQFG